MSFVVDISYLKDLTRLVSLVALADLMLPTGTELDARLVSLLAFCLKPSLDPNVTNSLATVA